jgi:hypothetical protein
MKPLLGNSLGMNIMYLAEAGTIFIQIFGASCESIIFEMERSMFYAERMVIIPLARRKLT